MKNFEDIYQTQGAFSWNELMSTDAAASCRYYSELFGWKIETSDMGTGPYHLIKIGETSVGGIMGMPPDAPPGMPSMWGCYVTVKDIAATLAAVKRLGGSVLMEPMEIKTVGRMAVIRDPQGATMSVIQYMGG